MNIEQVKFTDDEAAKVFSVMDDFKEIFCDFAKAYNIPANDANMLLQGAMMAFATFSCVNPFTTTINCKVIMNKLYGERSE